uniref:Ribosomal protein S4 n=1 Tax=Pyramimonas parkeae TaxID=36894 RepID=A0A1S5R1W6_9CHLO|nr:ribosomal protein S4 [Pyramimonas parkeae]ANA57066.1 ribosomal protein S4 [Pyramimonas parkeae]
MRLDTCLFHMNLFTSLGAARQAIRHGFVLVNGKRFHRASSILRPGDCIQFINIKSIQFINIKSIQFINITKHVIKNNKNFNIQMNPKIATGIILFNS